MKCVCNYCGAVMNVSPETGGRQVKCSQCAHTFLVPETFAISEDEILHILVDQPPIDGPFEAAAPPARAPTPEDRERTERVWRTALQNVAPDDEGRRRLVMSFRFRSVPHAKAFVKTLPFVRVVDKATGQIAFPNRIILELAALKGSRARVALRGQFSENELRAIQTGAPQHGALLEGVGW